MRTRIRLILAQAETIEQLTSRQWIRLKQAAA